MRRTELVENIVCAPYCTYYKPGKNEEVACQGASVVQLFVSAGRTISPAETRDASPGVVGTLKEVLCAACPFAEEDCDFMLARADAPPCGGFILLSRLIEAGVITSEELTAASRRSE